MADAVISVVVERVAAILEDQIRYQVNLLRGVEKEVRDVSDKLGTIRDVLDDAEKRGPKDKGVKRWLKKLEDTAYEMDDILDEWNYNLLKYKMEDPAAADVAAAMQKVCCSFIPSSSLCFKKVSDRRQTAKKIQNVKASLDRILKEKDDFKFVESQTTTEPPRPQTASLIDVEKVHGVDIDRNKNDIVSKLMDNGGSQIVCVVGMGGLGKTTLAQLVFNDTQVQGCFDLRIWICVSHPFDVDAIARGIVNKVGTETIPPDTNQLDLVLEKLRDSTSGKKFFLVLDDVWTEDYQKWEPLKMSLDFGAQGRKILVTTRNDKVATMMGTLHKDICRPKELTNGECWSLLRRISLSGKSEEKCKEFEECEDFEEVGLKMASKCKGLPLAAKVLGSLLQFKSNLEDWRNVLDSEIWRLEEAEEEAEKKLFAPLLLSYNELSPALKRCFSYCAVYPKDYGINVERLIEEWMALGYLGSVAGKGGVEVKGRGYFNNLARRSLFQDFEQDRMSGEIKWCKMHDILHDFAQSLRHNIQNARTEAPGMTKGSCRVCNPPSLSQVQEYRSLDWGRELRTSICNCVTSVRLFRFGGHWYPPRGMEKLIHLRWLELSDTGLSKEYLNIICRLYFLQTLLLGSCSIKEIPGEIGNLVELRRLDLTANRELKELPDSICNLVELRTLLLECCSLIEIPEKIGDLVHLRHLDLRNNRELKELPESMCSLVELQILNIEYCDLSRLPEGIDSLKNLQHLVNGYLDYVGRPAGNLIPEGLAKLSGFRTLTEFVGGSGCNKLGLLKYLNRLTGSLKLQIHICSIGDFEELVEDAREAKLRNKIHLHSLAIEFKVEEQQSSLWMDVIEALEPHHNLEILRINGYKGSRLPHWISSPLNLIKVIRLNYLSEVSSLPPMGKLPFLELLRIYEVKELKLVGREFLGIEESLSSSSTSSNHVVVVAFPKLKELTFSYCSKWSEWLDITAEEEESAAISIMPCLTDLEIYKCEGLKKLPHRLLRKASSSSLESVSIYSSPELIKSYGGKDGSSELIIPCRNNPQLDIL